MNSPTWREWQPPASELDLYDRVRANAMEHWGPNGQGLWLPSDGEPQVTLDIVPGNRILVNGEPFYIKRTTARPGTPSPTVMVGNMLLELGRWGQGVVDAEQLGDALMRRDFVRSRPGEVLRRWALAGLVEDITKEVPFRHARTGATPPPRTCRMKTPVSIIDHRDPNSLPPPPMLD